MGTRTRLNLRQIGSDISTFPNFDKEVEHIHNRISFLDELGNYDISYEYDVNGNISKEIVYDTTTPTPNALKTSEYTYNADGSLNTETVTKEGMRVLKTFAYDSAANLTGVSVRKVAL